jgi:hypothetical protein
MIEIPISVGEVIDKITILKIKKEKIKDKKKLDNIIKELNFLENRIKILNIIQEVDFITDKLKKINTSLWDIEDRLRNFEIQKKFDNEFIDNARNVYKLNDERFLLKKKINLLTQSQIIEEKSYCK